MRPIATETHDFPTIKRDECLSPIRATHALYEYDSHPYKTMSVIGINTNRPMRLYRIKLEK